jgi:hypothetical protein
VRPPYIGTTFCQICLMELKKDGVRKIMKKRCCWNTLKKERVSLWKSVKDNIAFPQRNAHPLPRDCYLKL